MTAAFLIPARGPLGAGQAASRNALTGVYPAKPKLSNGYARWQAGIVGTRRSAGAQAPGFLQRVWHERIHVLAPSIDFGALAAPGQRIVELFVAHRPESMLSYTATGNTGVQLSPDPAGRFGPLESKMVEVLAGLEGPAAIDAKFIFTAGELSGLLVVTGLRVVLIPFPPDWSESPRESRLYLSDVLTAHDGTEQRAARRSVARRGLKYRALLQTDDARQLKNLLTGWGTRIFAVPRWPQPAFLSAAQPEGTTQPNVNIADLRVGDLVIFYRDEKTYEIQSVSSLSPLTLASPTKIAWPAGTRVYPILLGRITGDPSFNRVTAEILTAALNLEETA